MDNLRTMSHYLRISIDVFLIIFVYFLSYYISSDFSFIHFNSSHFFLLTGIIAFWFFIGNSMMLYEEFRSRNFSIELLNLIKCIFFQTLLLIVLLFIFKELLLPKFFIFIFSFILFVLLLIEKFYLKQILQLLRRRGRNIRKILILGAGEVGEQFYKVIKENPNFGYHLVGFLDDKNSQVPDGLYLGMIDMLPEVLMENNIDDVIIALPTYAEKRIDWVLNICENYPVRIKIIPDYFKFLTSSKYKVSMFGKFPIISLRADRINELHWKLLKRLFDVIFSGILIILIFSWLSIIIAFFIKISSRGPVLFKQERWGRSNKRFTIYKFRTMIQSSQEIDKSGEYIFAIKNDPRVTIIGRILRKSNLDELPQLINIIRGEMSFVGPRPHPTPLNILAKNDISHYMLRHLAKPGLTGWAQINGLRGEASRIASLQSRVDYDLWYIENWSFQLDIQIILMTVYKMFVGDPHAY